MGTHRGLREIERHSITPASNPKPRSKPPPEAPGGGKPPDAQGKVVAVTTKEPGTPETNKTNPNNEQQVVQSLLAKLALPTPPPAEAWGATEGGVRETEVQAHATDVAAPHPTSTPAPAASQTLAFAVGGGGSLELDCRPCGGCGGSRRGVRLPARVYGFVAWVAGLLGVPMCRVVNEVPELLGVRVRRGGGVKARERELSRAVQFKASYLLGVVKHAGDLGEVVEHLRFAFEDYLSYKGGDDVDGFINGLLRELGFGSLLELALYLWWLMPSEVYGVMRGLVEPVTATRRGWVNVIKLRCRLDGVEIPTTVGLPAFVRIAVGHFRHAHGLATWRDVARAVVRAGEGEAVEYDEYRAKLLKLSADVSLALRLIAHRLEGAGAVERIGKRYRCKLCNADVGDVVEATAHFVNHHMNIMRTMRFSPHSSEPCEPGEVGASQVEEADTLTYRLACALRRQFGVRGPWLSEAERLLNELRSGLACSELALANAGFNPPGKYLEALRNAGICF